MSTKNQHLQHAKAGKNDEFYTKLFYIERELKHYKNNFKNKAVYCDDPLKSNFYHFLNIILNIWV